MANRGQPHQIRGGEQLRCQLKVTAVALIAGVRRSRPVEPREPYHMYGGGNLLVRTLRGKMAGGGDAHGRNSQFNI